ncbi:MAG: ABC transporter ATP-binding protein, partial [Spirochaetales bacterium]|nr:ABC transporter ATP-binding protein [Spirochaetales bacterium]
MGNILTTTDLRKIYKTDSEELLILNGINFALGEGQTVSITGESGSGKSTFLNMLGGLDSTTSGSIIIGGTDITSLDEYELTDFRNRRIGFIFQSHYLLEEFTAAENVMIPMLMNNFDRKMAADKAMDLLKLVGMDHRSHHYPSQLSGGERQRVAIARAFMNDPQIILADEPTGNLDEKNSAKVLDLLLDITQTKHFALIMVTHSMQSAKLTAKEYHLANGKLECVR